MSNSENIGNLIRTLRKVSGMSQMKLAEQMGITYQQVQKYEKGASELTLRRLRQVADALNVPMSTFIHDETGVAEPEGAYLTEEEANMVALLRRLKKNKLREKFLGMLRDIVEMTEKGS